MSSRNSKQMIKISNMMIRKVQRVLLLFVLAALFMPISLLKAQEIDLLRSKFGNGFLAVTPGIRPKWYTEGDDQVRICTPSEAFKKCASIIVIGRPITKSPSPQFALQQIIEEIKNA